MRQIKLSADETVRALLNLSAQNQVCFLDSCGVSHLGSHLLIAGIEPVEILQITNDDPHKTLEIFESKISARDLACIFTISYDFGLKLAKIEPRKKEFQSSPEPNVFLALFDCLIVHDYNKNKTYLTGNEKRFAKIERLLEKFSHSLDLIVAANSEITSNFRREEYCSTIKIIQERIRRGDTYQTNLTRQFRAKLPEELTAGQIFRQLRCQHPAPFAAFLKREKNFVISISPERFFRVERQNSENAKRFISASPIKGTRPRGKNEIEDEILRREILESAKDRAENVMIVDLLRNDTGKVCKFGSVKVEKLCDLETHPTLFHLVSTVKGELRENVNFSEIVEAIFPCGSITGAPKIRTMQIIDELETVNRGLSMGAIGCFIPDSKFQIPNSNLLPFLDLNVAIRTMVVRGGEAVFNVGGGIVIDSIPEEEYEETLVKAKALINALNGKFVN